MAFNSLGRILVVCGALIFLIGVVVLIGGRFGLGQLPGDISVRRGNTGISFPIMSSIVLSIVLTIVLNLLLRFFR